MNVYLLPKISKNFRNSLNLAHTILPMRLLVFPFRCCYTVDYCIDYNIGEVLLKMLHTFTSKYAVCL